MLRPSDIPRFSPSPTQGGSTSWTLESPMIGVCAGCLGFKVFKRQAYFQHKSLRKPRHVRYLSPVYLVLDQDAVRDCRAVQPGARQGFRQHHPLESTISPSSSHLNCACRLHGCRSFRLDAALGVGCQPLVGRTTSNSCSRLVI